MKNYPIFSRTIGYGIIFTPLPSYLVSIQEREVEARHNENCPYYLSSFQYYTNSSEGLLYD